MLIPAANHMLTRYTNSIEVFHSLHCLVSAASWRERLRRSLRTVVRTALMPRCSDPKNMLRKAIYIDYYTDVVELAGDTWTPHIGEHKAVFGP